MKKVSPSVSGNFIVWQREGVRQTLSRSKGRWYSEISTISSGFMHESVLVSYYPEFPSLAGWLSEHLMSFLERRKQGQAADSKSAAPPDKDFKVRYPALWDFLTMTVDDGGNAREVATLLVFCSEGQFRACLHDRATRGHLWACAAVWDDLLDSLEDRLTADSPDWREARDDGRTGKRR